MGSYVGYRHEKGMEAACGSSAFTKAFIYVLALLAILLKIASPFVVDLGSWFSMALLRLF